MHLVWYAALIALAAVLATYAISGSRTARCAAGRTPSTFSRSVTVKGELTKDDFERMRKDIMA